MADTETQQEIQQDAIPKDDNNNTTSPSDNDVLQAPETADNAETQQEATENEKSADNPNEENASASDETPNENQVTNNDNSVEATAESAESNDKPSESNDKPTEPTGDGETPENIENATSQEDQDKSDSQTEETSENTKDESSKENESSPPNDANQSQKSLKSESDEKPADVSNNSKTSLRDSEETNKPTSEEQSSSNENQGNMSSDNLQTTGANETLVLQEGKNEKEREELKKQINDLYEEVNKYKSQAHEFTLRCEHLEKKLEEAKKEAQISNEKRSKRQSTSSKPKRKPVRRRLRRIMRSEYVNYLTEEEESTIFESAELLYATVASKFPDISISQVLLAEKKFSEVDKNDDGTIYASELEMVLDSSGLTFTKQQVQDTLRKVDVDGTGSLDFFECLTVIDFIRAHRAGVTQEKNKSSLCVIM